MMLLSIIILVQLRSVFTGSSLLFKDTLFGLHPFPIGRLRLSHLDFSLLLKDCWPTQLLTSAIPLSGLISRDSNIFPPSTVNTRPLERIPSHVASCSSFQCQCLVPLRLARLQLYPFILLICDSRRGNLNHRSDYSLQKL